jgi:hypothetical protein
VITHQVGHKCNYYVLMLFSSTTGIINSKESKSK